MWVFMSGSFLSIVASDMFAEHLWVRARVKGDIERVFPQAKVTRTPKRDYMYRALLRRETVSAVIADSLQFIDYTNFKDSISKKDHKRHVSYLRVWSEMQRMQTGGKRCVSSGIWPSTP